MRRRSIEPLEPHQTSPVVWWETRNAASESTIPTCLEEAARLSAALRIGEMQRSSLFREKAIRPGICRFYIALTAAPYHPTTIWHFLPL